MVIKLNRPSSDKFQLRLALFGVLLKNSKFNFSIIFGLVSALVGVYLSVLTAGISSSAEQAIILLAFVLLVAMTSLATGFLLQILRIDVETEFRHKLRFLGVSKKSVANIDLILGVEVIDFYVSTVISTVTLLVYCSYLWWQYPWAALQLTLMIIGIAFPMKRFAAWRSRRIRFIRTLRNKLIDVPDNAVGFHGRAIDRFAQFRSRFHLRDVTVGVSIRLILVANIAITLVQNANPAQAIQIVLIELMIYGQIQSIFLGYTVFQENDRSMNSIMKIVKNKK